MLLATAAVVSWSAGCGADATADEAAEVAEPGCSAPRTAAGADSPRPRTAEPPDAAKPDTAGSDDATPDAVTVDTADVAVEPAEDGAFGGDESLLRFELAVVAAAEREPGFGVGDIRKVHDAAFRAWLREDTSVRGSVRSAAAFQSLFHTVTFLQSYARVIGERAVPDYEETDWGDPAALLRAMTGTDVPFVAPDGRYDAELVRTCMTRRYGAHILFTVPPPDAESFFEGDHSPPAVVARVRRYLREEHLGAARACHRRLVAKLPPGWEGDVAPSPGTAAAASTFAREHGLEGFAPNADPADAPNDPAAFACTADRVEALVKAAERPSAAVAAACFDEIDFPTPGLPHPAACCPSLCCPPAGAGSNVNPSTSPPRRNSGPKRWPPISNPSRRPRRPTRCSRMTPERSW